MQLAILIFVLGIQALPQWFQGLRRDLAYTPAVYNLVYHPRDIASYSYGGYGPQPTAVSTSSSTSNNGGITPETTNIPSEVFSPSWPLLSSTFSQEVFETSSNSAVVSSRSTQYSTTVRNKSTFSTSTTYPEPSLTASTITKVIKPLVCNHDNCLRAFLRTSAVTPFCATYTTVDSTATLRLPLFVSQCSGLPSRISSACSCLPTFTLSILTVSASTLLSTSELNSMTLSSSSAVTLDTSVSSAISSTTTIQVIVTSPTAVSYTPSILPGTVLSDFKVSSPDTSSPFPFSNQTSLDGLTGTGSSSVMLAVSVQSSTSSTSARLGTSGAANSSTVSISYQYYSRSGSPPAVAETVSYNVIAPTTAIFNSSYHRVTAHTSQYHTGGSKTIMQTGVSTPSFKSGAFQSTSSSSNPYFPITNVSSIGAIGSVTTSGLVTGFLPTNGSSAAYYSIGTATSAIVLTETDNTSPYSSWVASTTSRDSSSHILRNFSSVSLQSASSLPILSTDTSTTASADHTSHSGGYLPVSTGASWTPPLSAPSFRTFNNSTATTKSVLNSASGSADINLTVSGYILPTHHEGHRKHHHNDGDQHIDEEGDEFDIWARKDPQ